MAYEGLRPPHSETRCAARGAHEVDGLRVQPPVEMKGVYRAFLKHEMQAGQSNGTEREARIAQSMQCIQNKPRACGEPIERSP